MRKLVEGLSWRRGLAEMSVVVLGILIALAVDDWYAGRQDHAKELAWVQGLRDDLHADRRALEEQLAVLEESELVLRRLIELIDQPHIEVRDTADYLRMLKRATITYYFEPVTTTYQELTGSGSVSAISNRDLMRGYIEYLTAAGVTSELNDYVRQVKWFEFNRVFAEVIEPTLIAELTRDFFRSLDQWPQDSAPIPSGGVDLTEVRASQRFRTALARNLDASVAQRGDTYRMRAECDGILEVVEQELERLGL